ncbi:MAG TPA: hypothetical protein DCS07_11875 [Bdellovibrionales bacterium]|nr:hypothetical protein [Bdellovibrionales bacterium]
MGLLVTIRVPDDGTFKVINTKQHLELFKKNVEKMFPTTKYKSGLTPAEVRGSNSPSVSKEAATAITLYGTAAKAIEKMQAAVTSGAHEFENKAAEKQFNDVVKWLKEVAEQDEEKAAIKRGDPHAILIAKLKSLSKVNRITAAIENAHQLTEAEYLKYVVGTSDDYRTHGAYKERLADETARYRERVEPPAKPEPTQIKSAIGNNGQFDPQNPNINYAIGTASTATHEEMQSIEKAIEGKSMIQVAKWIAETSPNERYKLIAEKVAQKLIKMKAIGFNLDFKVLHDGDDLSVLGEARGLSNTDGNHVTVYIGGADTHLAGMNHEVVLHELVHATVTASIFDNKAAETNLYRENTEIMQAVWDHLTEKRRLGDELSTLENRVLNNPEYFGRHGEVIAWAFTNPEMQEMLEGIPYKTNMSLWDKFVNAIREFLGLAKEKWTALSEILRVGKEFIDAGPALYRGKEGRELQQQRTTEMGSGSNENISSELQGSRNRGNTQVGSEFDNKSRFSQREGSRTADNKRGTAIDGREQSITNSYLPDNASPSTVAKYNDYLDKAESALDAGDLDTANDWLDKAFQLEQNPKLAEPVKDADTKIRGLAQNIEDRSIEAGLIEYEGDLGELPTYKVRNMATAAARVRELMDSDPDRVQRIIDGEEPAPDGLYPEDVFTGVRVRATQNGDVDTLVALLSSPLVSEATTLGQRIKALDAGADSLDPFAAAKAISKKRQEDAKKTGADKAGSEAQAAEIERLKAELDAANAALDAKYAEHAVKKLKKEAEKKTRPADRAAKMEVLKSERKSIISQLNAKFGRISANPMFDPETISLMISLARNSIEMGINTAAGVIDSVHTDMKQFVARVRKRDIRDALSNYGKTKELSKEEVDVTLRELKRQWLLVSKIEDAGKGKFPELTGMKHDPKSDELRRMEKELHQIMKKNGLDTLHSPEDHMKTALDAAKTRLKNEIADLDRQIAAKKRDPVQKTGVKYDAEALKLKEIRDAKKEVLDHLDEKPGISVQRRIEITLNSLERSIEEYQRQIATGDFKRKVSAEGPETPAIKKLRDERDALHKVRDEKRALRAEMEKQGVPDEDPLITELDKFMADTERKIKAQETALDRSIEEYQRRIAEEDLNPEKKRSGTPEIPGTQRKKAVLASLKETYEQMKKDAKPPKDPEAIRLKTLKTRLTNEIAKFEKMLEGDDFTKQERSAPADLDAEGKKLKRERDRIKEDYQAAVNAAGTVTREEIAELVRLSKKTSDLLEDLEAKEAAGEPVDRLEYGGAKWDYVNYTDKLKGIDGPIKTQLSDFAKEIKKTWETNKAKAVKDAALKAAVTTAETSVATVASFDVSFGFMQGLKTLMTHPSAWVRGFKGQFTDAGITLRGGNADRRLMADIYSRRHYRDGSYQAAGIVKVKEEQFPTSIPEQAPVIGRAFKAANAAFAGAGLTMRADLFDLHADIMENNGVGTDKEWKEDIGLVINSMTGRGKWGKGGDQAFIRVLNWAPKLLKGNLDMLTAHGGTSGLNTTYAKKEAIKNIVKIVAETGILLMIAGALIPGGVEWDPTSSDFGTIRIGKTRFDVTAGLRTIIILAARMVYNHQKDPDSKLIIPYGTGFGQTNRLKVLAQFFINKAPPPTSVIATILEGKNRDNEPVTFGGAMFRAFTPISTQNAVKAKEDPSATAIVAALLSPFGINSNTYTDTGIQRRDLVNRLRSGKPLTSKQQAVYDQLDQEKISSIKKDAEVSPLVAKLRKLPIEQLAEAAKVAPFGIKAEIASEFRKKYYSARDLTPEEREKYKPILESLQDY